MNRKLLELYPQYDTVYGPYTRKDGRKHIILRNSESLKGSKGSVKTISYPKALYEATIGKKLSPNETIDHQDRDFTNDSFSNLRVRNRPSHSHLDVKRVILPESNCASCGKVFTLSREQCSERSKNKPGPFCSKNCASSTNKLKEKPTSERPGKDYFFLNKP